MQIVEILFVVERKDPVSRNSFWKNEKNVDQTLLNSKGFMNSETPTARTLLHAVVQKCCKASLVPLPGLSLCFLPKFMIPYIHRIRSQKKSF